MRLGEHDLVIHEGQEREYTVSRTILHPSYNRYGNILLYSLLRGLTSEDEITGHALILI